MTNKFKAVENYLNQTVLEMNQEVRAVLALLIVQQHLI